MEKIANVAEARARLLASAEGIASVRKFLDPREDAAVYLQQAENLVRRIEAFAILKEV